MKQIRNSQHLGTRSAIGGGIIVAVALVIAGATDAADASDTTPVGAKSQHDENAPRQRGNIIVPESSKQKPGDVGKRAHTNYEILNTHGPLVAPARKSPNHLK